MTSEESLPVAVVKRDFSRVLDAAEHGQRTLILRHGRPVAALGPIHPERADLPVPRRPGGLLARIQVIADTVPVLPFHEAAARTYAELRADLERHGTPLAEPDLRIAAIALTFNLVLGTGNERHFRRVPDLVVENWLESRR